MGPTTTMLGFEEQEETMELNGRMKGKRRKLGRTGRRRVTIVDSKQARFRAECPSEFEVEENQNCACMSPLFVQLLFCLCSFISLGPAS